MIRISFCNFLEPQLSRRRSVTWPRYGRSGYHIQSFQTIWRSNAWMNPFQKNLLSVLSLFFERRVVITVNGFLWLEYIWFWMFRYKKSSKFYILHLKELVLQSFFWKGFIHVIVLKIDYKSWVKVQLWTVTKYFEFFLSNLHGKFTE